MKRSEQDTIKTAADAIEDLEQSKRLFISAPDIGRMLVCIRGTSPLVTCAFSQKAREAIKAGFAKGDKEKRKKKKDRKPKTKEDFKQEYEDAKHVSTDGWCGVPASGVRTGLVDACRADGYEMTKAKMAVFVEPDGYDRVDGTPLVKIRKGKPHYHEMHARPQRNTIDIRCRPMWNPGWEALVPLMWDASMLDQVDVLNLLLRLGLQVGICEGRHFSKNSCGLGWGCFELLNPDGTPVLTLPEQTKASPTRVLEEGRERKTAKKKTRMKKRTRK